jgi:hypothetical protein
MVEVLLIGIIISILGIILVGDDRCAITGLTKKETLKGYKNEFN